MSSQTVTASSGRKDPSRLEIRRYGADGWLHLYRADELKSGQELVTPQCAVLTPFYGVDHERALISAPTQRGEIHPGCLTPRPVIPAQDPAATVVMPVLAEAIRGRL